VESLTSIMLRGKIIDVDRLNEQSLISLFEEIDAEEGACEVDSSQHNESQDDGVVLLGKKHD